MQRNITHPPQPESPPALVACAACKHQRKKCTGNCELASYFPADRTREFGLVHKVFGVSNLTKMLKAIDSAPNRERAAETLTWEAEWRNIEPSEGCYNEVMRLKDENAMLRDVITRCSSCSSLKLPPPYHSPVPQTDGNNHNNGGDRHLIYNHEGINNNNNNNNGNVGRSMGVVPIVPQQMINHPVTTGNLINGYHNLHLPMYMFLPDNGGRWNIGHGDPILQTTMDERGKMWKNIY